MPIVSGTHNRLCHGIEQAKCALWGGDIKLSWLTMASNSDYNVEQVLHQIDDNSPEESRMLFEEKIFDWTDKYTESLSTKDLTCENAHAAAESIISLWVEYAVFEQRLRQWKKVVQVYENALNDELTSKSPRVFIAYANFCKSRGKIANAQKVYLRALCLPLAAEDLDMIWAELLTTMRENGSPDITFDHLYTAVSSQVGYESLNKPSAGLLNQIDTLEPDANDKEEAREPKKLKTTTSQVDGIETSNGCVPDDTVLEVRDSHIAEAGTSPTVSGVQEYSLQHGQPLQIESASLPFVDEEDKHPVECFTDMQDISTAALLESFPVRPTLLFRALSPQDFKQATSSPGAGFAQIQPSLLHEIESFFGMTVPMICEADRSSPDSSVRRTLDLIEGMFVGQALQERQFDSWYTQLMEMHREELRDVEAGMDKVSLGGTSVEVQRSLQNMEMRNFRIRCGLQMDILNASVNRILEKTLSEQLLLLSQVEKFPHAACSSNKSLLVTENGEQQLEFALLKQVVNALLSVRLYSRGSSGGRHTQQHTNKAGPGSVSNILSGERSYSGDFHSLPPGHEDTRADMVATKRKFRSKRRKATENSLKHAYIQGAGYGSDIAAGGMSFSTVSQFGRGNISSTAENRRQESSIIKPASNLAKLAAMLGKGSKSS